ncbi:carbohydrate ABC transporter permease [Fundicoccus culcitae]|uniref:Sugar ABC transporter permease n=1 Tax=Fundicoccus culcitae TaxID=2969821 RepID=A0ABY5P8D7_9LACT|nr:sugar ABC transporter permease [Fundicoccus culcitae]UUX35012.1 sugar ABC transporter permease [Fundicoccus culcitae]
MKHKFAPYLFIAPAFILLIMFSLIPIIVSLVISFTDMNLAGLADYSRINFIGTENYNNIINDPVFLTSIKNTLYYAIIGVPLVLILSLALAIFINMGNNRYFSFMRLVFYSPSITNIVAVAVVWSFIFNPNQSIGLLNQLLSYVGIGPIGWLTDPSVSKLSLIILAVWKGIGINMLIFSAALQNIPDSMYEAAELDGASKWQQIRYITIPQLKFSTFFVLVTTIIGWLQFFEEPFIMTDGGPLNSTISVSLFIYRNGFQLNRFGYAAAGSLLLFVVIIAATIIQMRIQNKSRQE